VSVLSPILPQTPVTRIEDVVVHLTAIDQALRSWEKAPLAHLIRGAHAVDAV